MVRLSWCGHSRGMSRPRRRRNCCAAWTTPRAPWSLPVATASSWTTPSSASAFPGRGFQHYSPFRAANQVLKLALALVWEPLDPHRLLQFLIHPVSPLPWRVRGRLARAVASAPGIGGPAWCEAMASLGDEKSENIEFWTTPDRYGAGEGAPVQAVSARVRRLRRLAGAEDGHRRGRRGRRRLSHRVRPGRSARRQLGPAARTRIRQESRWSSWTPWWTT